MSRTALSVAGSTVVVTGGARGIGRATATELLRRGARVAIGDVDEVAVEKTAAELAESTGGDVIGMVCDVRDPEAFSAFLHAAAAALGPVSVVVNNAGIMPTGRFGDESADMTHRMVDINLYGVINGSRAAIEHFAGRPGHIINVASLAGVAGFPGLATYCATKHAVLGFTEALHRELRDEGIGVTAVLPGVVRTELSAGNSVPNWVRPAAEVDPEDVAVAIADVIGTSKTRVSVPRALSVMLKVMSVMPDGAQQWMERTAKFDTAFTNVDAAARADYQRRITG